jgi:RNA polymerase sigma factor (sigma-70 family)
MANSCQVVAGSRNSTHEMPHESTDAELVAQSRRGHAPAFGRLVERHQAVVRAVSYAAVGDRALAEDVAQDTFLAAWRQLDRLADVAQLRAWLCAIARNLGRRARRRGGREILDEAPLDRLIADATPFDDAHRRQVARAVDAALAAVPPRYREALILFYREGRSARQVADALGIHEAAALQRLSRGRRCLADGVAGLVEHDLAASRPSRPLSAAVLAALPARPSLASSLTPHQGPAMFKLALALSALAATGTIATVAVRASAADHPLAAAAAAPSARAGAPAEHPSRPPAAHPRPRFAPAAAAAPATEATIVRQVEDPAAPVDPDTIVRLGLHQGPARGPADAPVTIVVFTDFQCDFCGQVLGTIDQLWDDYPGQLRLVVKQFPVHETARLAAEAALAAEDQGKFWELHDLLLAHQDDLSRGAILALAAQAGLDVPRLATALERGTFRTALDVDVASGVEIGVQGTPAFLINGQRFTGARPVEILKASIDAALAAARR